MAAEPKIGANTGNAGKGRPKGAQNKTTTQAKQAIALAAEGLGGTERLIAWAQEDPKNESVFWSSIYTKLVPLDVIGTHDVTIVDRTELLQRASEQVREVFGDRTGDGQSLDGRGLPH
jgi:hypothetical protein